MRMVNARDWPVPAVLRECAAPSNIIWCAETTLERATREMFNHRFIFISFASWPSSAAMALRLWPPLAWLCWGGRAAGPASLCCAPLLCSASLAIFLRLPSPMVVVVVVPMVVAVVVVVVVVVVVQAAAWIVPG